MRKLQLDSLQVDSFVTSPTAGGRGTVLGHDNTGTGACPISYGGTCVITCRKTCDL